MYREWTEEQEREAQHKFEKTLLVEPTEQTFLLGPMLAFTLIVLGTSCIFASIIYPDLGRSFFGAWLAFASSWVAGALLRHKLLN